MGADRIVILTPWYPSEVRPFAGAFVREWVRALGAKAAHVTVVHVENVEPGAALDVTRIKKAEGLVVRVPVVIPPRTPRVRISRLQRDALANVAEVVSGATVVHAHVALPTAWAALPYLSPTARVITVEHASYVQVAVEEPGTRSQYSAVLARSDQHLVASDREARLLRREFPAERQRIVAVGNPIDLEKYPFRERSASALNRWLYVGSLLRTKGAPQVLESFAAFAVRDGREGATLTFVGDGLERNAMEQRASALGLADRVAFAGAVAPDEVASAYADADVLVHLSVRETFGMSCVEAAVAGLPVVVTRCGGPEETLAFAERRGRASFVPVGASGSAVADAVERLEVSLGRSDAHAVRDDLEFRFGADVFGDRVRRVTRGDSWVAEDEGSSMSVAVLSFSQRARSDAHDVTRAAVNAGARTIYVTEDTTDAREMDPRATVINLGCRVYMSPARILERLVMRWIPLAAIAVLRRPLRWGTRLPGPLARAAAKAARILTKVRGVVLRIGDKLHGLAEALWYQWTSGAPFARAALRRRRHVWGEPVDVVVYAEPKSLFLAWTLARRWPDAEIVRGIAREDVMRRLRETSGD